MITMRSFINFDASLNPRTTLGSMPIPTMVADDPRPTKEKAIDNWRKHLPSYGQARNNLAEAWKPAPRQWVSNIAWRNP